MKTRLERRLIRVDRCDACGQIKPVHSHHLALEENDSEFTADTCVEDHSRYLTPWHDVSGVLPGIDPSGARLTGVSQYFSLLWQRHGFSEFAQYFRNTDYAGSLDRTGKELVWARPRRIGKPVGTDEILSPESSMTKLMGSLMRRTASDPRLTPSLSVMLTTFGDCLSLMGEYPKHWASYLETGPVGTGEVTITLAANDVNPLDVMEKYLSAVMPLFNGFLRYMRNHHE